MRIDDFDYDLPQELIAQTPAATRDASRLMVVHRDSGQVEHRHFYDILDYLRPSDCLVLNDSKVLPARLLGVKEDTGARVEFLLTKHLEGDTWETMVRPGRRLKPGDRVIFSGAGDEGEAPNANAVTRDGAAPDGNAAETAAKPGAGVCSNAGRLDDAGTVPIADVTPKDAAMRDGLGMPKGGLPDVGAALRGDTALGESVMRAVVKAYGPDGTRIVEFQYEGIFMERLEELGRMPLPPYIHRESRPEDRDRYQTVYCREEGSVAAPTAGLHFTRDLLARVEEKGVKTAYVTLHVGIGTFRPVKEETVEAHRMHFESYHIGEEAARTINDTIRAGGRIVSVGTTSTRTLESASYLDAASGKWLVQAGSSSTGIFIYPGYEFRIIGALITNFHLPRSTLLMLVSAFYNREDILRVYDIAVKERYRFFSYGDAMLLE